MPDHIKLILRHAMLGGLIAVGFVSALLVLNVGNLWHLVTHTAEGPMAVVVLTVLCWITFGSVQIGIKIMSLGEDRGDGGGTRKPEAVRPYIPARAHMTKTVPIETGAAPR